MVPQARQHKLPPLYNQPQIRKYAAHPPQTKRRLPQNELIRGRYVHIVGEDGQLGEPEELSRILRYLNRDTEVLQAVSLPHANNTDPDAPQYPVCRVISKQAIRDAEKAAKLKKRPASNPANVVKKMEINWAIDPNDLGHRLNKLREFLGKGYRVEVLLAGKRKGRRARFEEATEVLEKIRALGISDECKALGWTEMKPPLGLLGGIMTIFLEGKLQKKDAAKQNEDGDGQTIMAASA